MNERDLWWKITGVGILIALAFASFWPMKEKIKYGIDLYGGYSLTYEIDDSGLSPAERSNLAERVIKVLKDRIDPKGVFNLVWRPIGHNRLEIHMPRPSDTVRLAREDYERHQSTIAASHVRRSEIMRAISRKGADRDAAIAALLRKIDSRRALLEGAAKAYDAHEAAQAEYDVRVKKIKEDSLTAKDISDALAKLPAERAAAFAVLIRGVPERQALLEDAAKTYDELEAARPSTQPSVDTTTSQPGTTSAPSRETLAGFAAKKRAYDDAIARVLATNLDPNNLKDGMTINKVVELEEKLDKAVADVLATNVEIGNLQAALDAKPTDPNRKATLAKLNEQYPGLAADIEGMVKAGDALKQRRRGEGRLEDPADLQRLLRGTGVLEYRILAKRDAANETRFDPYVNLLKEHGPRPRPGEDQFQWFEIENPKDFLKLDNPQRDFEGRKRNLPGDIIVDRFGDKFYVLAHIAEGYALVHKSGAQEWSLKSARPDSDENGLPQLSFTLDERGGSRFDSLTRSNIQHQLAIFLDDQCISHATIQSAIRTSGRITGSFSRQEVEEMAHKLNAGSLPKKLKDPPISVRSIGSSLGDANSRAGLKSALIGAIVVIIIMIGYYSYSGFVAIIAVTMNTMLVMAATAVLGATLTLPSIAGLVLSVGMGVDTNVLLNERMREEADKGANVRMAVKLGYERAFSAIIDSHLSTILTCVILYFLGSEDVKGFGLTLGIGVLVNLFTAYTVTRVYFEMMTLPRVPGEVKRYPIMTAIGVLVAGAVFYGLGMAFVAPENQAQSGLIAFGRTMLWGGPIMLIVIGTFWLCRTLHGMMQKTGEKEHLPMRHMIGAPKIDWCGKRWAFYTVSLIGVFTGAFLFFGMPKEKLYDIEFLGGTAAEIDLKTPGSLSTEDVRARLKKSSETLAASSKAMNDATIHGMGDTWTVASPGVPASRLAPIVKAVMDKELSELSPVTYSDPAANELSIRTKTDAHLDEAAMRERLKAFAARLQTSAESIGDAQVQTIGEEKKSFEVVTRETSKEIVVASIMENLRDFIDVQPALTFKLMKSQGGSGPPFFPIRSEKASEIGLPIAENEAAMLDLQGWRGGVAIVLDQISPPQTVDSVKKRLRAMRFQPGFEQSGWRESECIGLTTADPTGATYSRMAVVVSDEAFPLEQGTEPTGTWVSDFAEKEVKLVQSALERQTSLSQITQFDKQVSQGATQNAMFALVLSWLGIIIYLWFRFGDFRWGAAAVVALVHDIFIVCLFIGIAHLIGESTIGQWLHLEKFRVDLTMVAAFLTIVGYSVNDTIIVYDRIRENRGRARGLSVRVVNESISQTLSRTILTSLTVFATSLVMYIWGGKGIHGFNYALCIGIITGTYSSFAVAGQLLLSRRVRAATAAAA